MTPLTTRDQGRSREPVPPAPRMNLSNRMVIVWNRGKAKINRLLHITPLRMRAVRDSTCRFPPELTEMIIAHLIGDLHALKTFSLICREWYIAAVPHLHHTLTLRDTTPDKTHDELKPISGLHKLGLASLAKEIRVIQSHHRMGDCWFEPQTFSRRDLRHFSAFTNVQTLTLQNVDISRFMPDVDRYFGHFTSTLRSIVLAQPRCTPQQLSSFLSLFSNLDDIYIYSPVDKPTKIVCDSELVLFSSPKLRGRLELFDCTWVETFADLTTLCGGLQFHDINLRSPASDAPILQGACAETLETLRFDMLGFYLSSLLPEFDLSRFKALRSLQIGAWATSWHPTNRYEIVMEMFSTITSPVFSELVIVLEGDEIAGLLSDVELFETLRKMNEVRPFTLVFLVKADEPYCGRTEEMERLKDVITLATVTGLLNFLDSRPVVRITRLPTPEWEVGPKKGWPGGYLCCRLAPLSPITTGSSSQDDRSSVGRDSM